MPKTPGSIESMLESAISDAVRKVSPAIQRHIAALAAAQLEEQLRVRSPHREANGLRRPRARNVEITKWVADRKARRVPSFVIELTGGLDTKKKIVARFGDGAVFERGKPLPKALK